jgi:hypothetical protein
LESLELTVAVAVELLKEMLQLVVALLIALVES